MVFPPHENDLLPQVPLAARIIVDVGCNTGNLGAVYRAMNPQARLFGLAADTAAAERAAAQLHQVVTADLASWALPFDLADGADCIIYNEILEQLADPWGLLRRHAEALSVDGMMLVRVRNGEHWRVAERLLRGRGQDDDADRPWLPGFSRDAMHAGLAGAGLTTCAVVTPPPDGDAATRFAAYLAPGLEALGVDPREYAKRSGPTHLIWRVRREKFRRIHVAANMLDPVGGVSHVRVVYPIQAIATDPTVSAGVTDRVDIADADDAGSRIFVLHRPALVGQQGHALLRALTEAGFLVVTEFDDLPDRFDMMRLGGELGFRGVHALQTSTAAMAEALRQYNPEIAVFPNAIPMLPEVRNFADPNSMTMFFGALNREPDWRPFMPAINAVARLAGERLRFQVVHDQGFFEALDTAHKAFTPTCDYQTYLRLLGGSEISFMPLSDTPFNRAKSDLKFIEAGACRVAALASSVVYANSIDEGRTGLLFRDPVALHRRLLQLVAMPEMARDLGNAARQYVADHRMLAYQVAPRIAWYRSLLARRESLNDARRQRMMRYQVAA